MASSLASPTRCLVSCWRTAAACMDKHRIFATAYRALATPRAPLYRRVAARASVTWRAYAVAPQHAHHRATTPRALSYPPRRAATLLRAWRAPSETKGINLTLLQLITDKQAMQRRHNSLFIRHHRATHAWHCRQPPRAYSPVTSNMDRNACSRGLCASPAFPFWLPLAAARLFCLTPAVPLHL